MHLTKNVILPKIKDFTKSQSQNTKTQETLPSINGGKNVPAIGHAIPIIVGKTLFAPFTLATGYSSISDTDDGSDEYYNQLYLIGYSGITVRDVYLGKNFLLSKEDTPFEEGVITVNPKLKKDYDISLELRQSDNEVSLYPQKIVQTDLNTELTCFKDKDGNAERLEANGFSAKYPMKVAVRCQLESLIGYSKDDGSPVDNSVSVGVSMSLDGGKTWQPFGANFKGGVAGANETLNGYPCSVTTFTRKKTKTMRFEAVKTFDFNTAKNITHNKVFIKIMRKEAKDLTNDGTKQDTVVATKITTWCYDPKLSVNDFVVRTPLLHEYNARTARIGLRIKATSDIQGQLDELNLIATSKCRIWNGTSWTSEKYETTNPSAVALHLLTSETIRTRKYAYNIINGTEIINNKVDEESFGRFYEWCNENFNFGTDKESDILQRFSCDGAVVNQQKTIDLTKQILSLGRGFLVLNGSKYSVMIDKPRENPVMILNNQNILDFSSQKNFENLPDGYSVEYIDAIQKYIQNSFIAVPDGVSTDDPKIKLEGKSYPYTTNVKRAYCRAMYELANQKLRPETWTITTSVDGKLIEVGSLIEVQSDTITVGVGDGAEVQSVISDNNYITGITVDTPFYVTDETKDYGVRITVANGVGNPAIIKRKLRNIKKGYNTELSFNESILSSELIPTKGDIVSFGLYEKETTDALCLGKKDNGDGTFVLTCVPYDERIYEADSGLIPTFNDDITEPSDNGTGTDDNVQLSDVYNAVKNSSDAIMSSVQRLYSNHVVTLYRELKADEAPLTETGITSNLVYNFATNTIEWVNEEESNGWKIEYPVNPTLPVYVTSATAFGQSETDVIQYTEWVKPVTVGLNGVNGLSVATITMYKRSVNEPAKPAFGGTYNFNTGDFVFDSSVDTWSRAIPPLDAESNPVWETHVTALSVDAVDSSGQLTTRIDAEKWSKPIQISVNVAMSKEEIEALIKDTVADASTPYIIASVNNIGFSINDAGYTPINQSVEIEITVVQYGDELDYIFGDLSEVIPPEFSWKISGKKITITAETGKRISKLYNIPIPLIFRELRENYHYHESPSYGGSTSDMAVYANIHYELQHEQPIDWNDNYNAYYVSDNGVPVLNTSSEWVADTFYRKVIDTAYGYLEYQDYSTIQNCNITIQGIIGGTHLPVCSTLDEVTALMNKNNLVIGDYFTWLGQTTASELALEGQFVQRCNYLFIGGNNVFQWQKDTDSTHTAITLPDVISGAMEELEIAENEQVDNYFKKVFGSEIVAKRLVAQTGLIDEIFSEKITLKGKGDKLAYIQALNSKNEIGFKLDSDGHAILNDADVRGNITAKSLKIITDNGDKPIIAENGYINAELLDVDAITTGFLKADDLVTKDLTIQGGIRATRGFCCVNTIKITGANSIVAGLSKISASVIVEEYHVIIPYFCTGLITIGDQWGVNYREYIPITLTKSVNIIMGITTIEIKCINGDIFKISYSLMGNTKIYLNNIELTENLGGTLFF